MAELVVVIRTLQDAGYTPVIATTEKIPAITTIAETYQIEHVTIPVSADYLIRLCKIVLVSWLTNQSSLTDIIKEINDAEMIHCLIVDSIPRILDDTCLVRMTGPGVLR